MKSATLNCAVTMDDDYFFSVVLAEKVPPTFDDLDEYLDYRKANS